MERKRKKEKGSPPKPKDAPGGPTKPTDKKLKVKSPYDRREEAITDDAFKKAARSTRPVAKDTNKTRRVMKKPA